MWKDEWQAWLLASESGSLAELWQNVRFEPQPGMWHVILWLLSRIWMNPFVMQLFHVLCGTASAALVMKYAPFPAWMRLLTVTGYYLSFEYLLISRNYVLVVFMVMLFCSFYDEIRRKPITAGIVLGVLANTSIFGAMESLLFYGGLMTDKLVNSSRTPQDRTVIRQYAVRITALYLPLFLFSFSVMLLSQGTYGAGWRFDNLFYRYSLMRASIPLLSIARVPAWTPFFWETLWITITNNLAFILACWIMTACSIIIILRRTRIGLWAFLSLFSLMEFLQYTKNMELARYSGHLFVFLLACVWLGCNSWKSSHATGPFTGLSRSLFAMLLALNTLGGVIAGYFHATTVFANGKTMASLIREYDYSSRPIVADDDFGCIPVSGYLGQKLYSASTGKLQSFVPWDEHKSAYVPDDWTMNKTLVIKEVENKTGKVPLVLLDYSMPEWSRFLVLKAEGSIASEDYYLYDLAPIIETDIRALPEARDVHSRRIANYPVR